MTVSRNTPRQSTVSVTVHMYVSPCEIISVYWRSFRNKSLIFPKKFFESGVLIFEPTFVLYCGSFSIQKRLELLTVCSSLLLNKITITVVTQIKSSSNSSSSTSTSSNSIDSSIDISTINKTSSSSTNSSSSIDSSSTISSINSTNSNTNMNSSSSKSNSSISTKKIRIKSNTSKSTVIIRIRKIRSKIKTIIGVFRAVWIGSARMFVWIGR